MDVNVVENIKNLLVVNYGLVKRASWLESLGFHSLQKECYKIAEGFRFMPLSENLICKRV